MRCDRCGKKTHRGLNAVQCVNVTDGIWTALICLDCLEWLRKGPNMKYVENSDAMGWSKLPQYQYTVQNVMRVGR